MDDFWGVFISVQLCIILFIEVLRWVIDSRKPLPLSMPQLFMVIDTLELNTKGIEKLIDNLISENATNKQETLNFIFEELRRRDKREFDKKLQKKKDEEGNI